MDKRLKKLIKAYTNAQFIRIRAVENYKRHIKVYNSMIKAYKIRLNYMKDPETTLISSNREISLIIKRQKCQINKLAKYCKEAKQIVKDSDKTITEIIELIDEYTSTDKKEKERICSTN